MRHNQDFILHIHDRDLAEIILAFALVVTIVAGIAFYVSYNAQFGIQWRDFGTVQNLHDVPGWTDLGAQYYENMTILTDHHGTINFDTAPGGNMCSPILPFPSCGAGTVAWNNGTRVFVEYLKGGGVYAGALNR
jgi:hypothetical protein